MGRHSKLTDKQWADIEKRIIAGETVRGLAKEYGVSPGTISGRFSNSVQEIKNVANQLVEAETSFAKLNISGQIAARSLADKLKSLSNHLADAAELGARTSHRLAAIANQHSDKIDDAEPEKSIETIKTIAALTATANEAAKTGLNLLAANKKNASEEEAGQKRVVVVNSPDA